MIKAIESPRFYRWSVVFLPLGVYTIDEVISWKKKNWARSLLRIEKHLA